MTRFVLPITLLTTAIVIVALPASAPGCLAVSHPDERVTIADESALIVWDEATKTEHFIRRARFESSAYDFGFLVPTPTRPQLEEADESLFADLTALTAAKIVYETRERKEEFAGLGCGTPAAMYDDLSLGNVKSAAPGGVNVLEQKRVGNFDVAVLGFKPGANLSPEESAADVLKWLTDHGYAVKPDHVDWIKIYARDKWVLTAFKIAGVPPAGRDPVPPKEKDAKKNPRDHAITLNSTAVRMSFQTERPFYPYREPAGQRVDQSPGSHRLLRVFVAAKQRVNGKLGDGSQPWPGRTVWANAIPEPSLVSLHTKGKLPPATEPTAWRVTEFEDHSSPRPGIDEVYFEPAADQSVIERPPHVVTRYVTVRTYPWWFGPVVVGGPLLVIIAAGLILRRMWPSK